MPRFLKFLDGPDKPVHRFFLQQAGFRFPAGIFSFLVIYFLSYFSCIAQQPEGFVLGKTIEGDIVDFRVDKLGNIYLLSSGNQLKKLSPAGDSLAVFNEVRRYGKLEYLDVTNPLKILLYYKEFATIVVVDRFLNILSSIDLRNQKIFQAKAIGLAYDNNIWVYDELEAKLKRLGDDGTLVDKSPDIRQMVDAAPEPTMLSDQGGLVYLFDPSKGVYMFDHYGAFTKLIPLPGWQDFSVIEKSLLGRNQHFFFRYQTDQPSIQQEPIPAAFLSALKISILPGLTYVLKQNKLEIYSRR